MGWLDSIFGSSQDQSGQPAAKPTGLLSGLDPQTIGLLSASAAMFERSGPSTRPTSFGQVLGSGLLTGLKGYQGAIDGQSEREEREQMKLYRQAQMGELTRKAESSKELNDFFKSRLLGGSSALPGASASPSMPGMSGLLPAAASAGGSPMFMSGAAPASSTKAGGNRAASMDGGVFWRAAERANLGTDNATLNRIIDLVNQGMEPDEAAQSLSQGGGKSGAASSGMAGLGGAAPGQTQQGGAFPFSLNEIAYMKTKGVDLADVYKLATDPIKMEGNALYRDRATGQERWVPKVGEGMNLGPNGAVSLTPGYLDAMSAVKGAETRATEANKANFDLLPLGYVGQDGRPIGGTRGDYVNSFRQPQAPAQGGAPGREGLDLTRLTPQQQAFLRQQNPDAFANGVARFSTPPVLQSEAERQQQVGAVTSRQGTQTDLNKNWITSSYNPVVEAGRSASSITASLDSLKNINLQTGWGTEAKAHAASVLTGLGIAPQNAKLFAANVEKFQSVAMDRLLTTLQAQKGMQTEGDAARAQETFAQLKNTPEANQFISDFARAKANADARRAQFYQEALPLAQQTGDLNEIDRRWTKIRGSIWSDPILKPYIRSK